MYLSDTKVFHSTGDPLGVSVVEVRDRKGGGFEARSVVLVPIEVVGGACWTSPNEGVDMTSDVKRWQQLVWLSRNCRDGPTM